MKLFKSDKQEIRFYVIATPILLIVYVMLSILNNIGL